MTIGLMVSMWAALIMAIVYLFEASRKLARANSQISDYATAIDEWAAYAASLESMVDSSQGFALTVASRRKGHKGQLPIVVGKSNTAIVMVDDIPMIDVKEFRNRKGEIVKLDSVTTEETKTEAAPLPASESKIGVSSEELIAKVESDLSDKLTDSEKSKIETWNKAGKDTKEFANWIKGIRKSQKKQAKAA